MSENIKRVLAGGPRDPVYAAEPETVDHPEHYNANPSGVECIDVVEWMTFNQGNAVKYLWRMSGKGAPVENLRKAIWYCEREIKRLEARDEHS